ncbi:hypothetical protein M413DRAFT_444305 [Hebeloma cylindrosporum]|uniref:C2H2-type domain-containing protein n=1 Tax=Hebeloma cylindrosporum TaxID=76867 RepID=A0A0C3C184_HEBCY|nr:hypothetical protein M413DRAFT_444305 [Hebeloma cylindrosporum h7]
MATTVSLPSIHEMFPDHLIHDRGETARPSSSSLRGTTRNPHPSFSGHPHAHRPHPHHHPSHDHHRRDEETSDRRDGPLPYAYTILRSSPTTASLTHLSSSVSRVSSGRSVPSHNNGGFRVDPVAGPSSHRPYPGSLSRPTLDPQDQFSGAYIHSSHPRALPPISPMDVSSSSARRVKPTSGRAIAYEHGEMIMDTNPDPRDGSLDPDDDGDGGMNGQLGTGQGKKHICPSCFKRFNRPSSLRIHENTHTGATPFRCPWPNCGREFNVNSNMRRHYRNHTTPGAPRGSGAVRAAGPPQPPRIPPPPHSGTQRQLRPSHRATKSGPSSEDEEEFDELDSDMDVDPHPRASERQRRGNGNVYPTPPNSYPSDSASPHLHPSSASRSSPPRRGGSRSPSYSPRVGERGHAYAYSSPSLQPDLVHVRYQHSAVRDKGYADSPYVCRRDHRDYSPQSSSNGSPASSHPRRLSDRRGYACDDDDEDEEEEDEKRMIHRGRRPMTPRSSLHSSSPSPSVGDDVREGGSSVKKEYQYNLSRPYEDAVKDGRVSTTLRKVVY